MRTLARLIDRDEGVPSATVWYLTDVAEARGRQQWWEEEFRHRLAALHARVMVESALSSIRLDGGVADSRADGVAGGDASDGRFEAEARGYDEARKAIEGEWADQPLSEETITHLHGLCRPGAPDAGRYGQHPIDVVETGPDGSYRVRLAPVNAADVPGAVADIVGHWNQCLANRSIHPLIALAAFNLDFLCIHPFQHGNGVVSRLLWLLQSRHLGYRVGRYVSLERVIEGTKDRYYETLLQSSVGWHEGTNDPWPYVNYVLATMRSAYAELADALA